VINDFKEFVLVVALCLVGEKKELKRGVLLIKTKE